jgi:hypothetical protein
VRRARSRARGSGLSKEKLAQVRQWGRANGREVGNRGRIPSDLLDAFNVANANA